MITVLVEFKLPATMTLTQARDAFLASAPRYRDLPGLLRKHYLLADDGKSAGGVYLWRKRAEAEAFYDAQWVAFVSEKYGAAPVVRYFESPVIVDNEAGRISAD